MQASALSRVPRPGVLDVGLACALGVVVGIGVTRSATGHTAARELDVWAYVLVVVATLALAWWRSVPLAALAGSVIATSAYLLLGYPFGPIQLCMVLAMFAVAWRQSPARSLPACAIAATVSTASVVPRLVSQADSPALMLAAWTSWLIVPWSIGALLHIRAAAARRSRQELIARTALTERMRLARDVHDAVGHGLAVIAMQAGIAQLVFDEQPDQVRKSLRAIDETSRTALDELRATLQTLDDPGTGNPPQTEFVEIELAEPAASARLGVPEISALVERVRHAGLDTTLHIDQAVSSLPLTAQQHTTIYRIVQESLTNVLQHAGPAQAWVHIDRDGSDVTVVVTDSGSGAEQASGNGRGLAGMRARVEALRGRLETGPSQQGGFAVRARIPITQGATA